jgi:probable HAF family extracellular repeat protein
MRDLGTLPGDASSQANGINASDQAVGWSGTADGSMSRAFLWQNGAMSDLNTLIPSGSGWILTTATAINDAGQIAGSGLHAGQPRAFLLTKPIGNSSEALVAAVLPSSRSVRVDGSATAFATMINTSGAPATGCGLSLASDVPASLSFQTTDPASNRLTGAQNAPATIAGGAAQTFMFALTPVAPLAPTDVQLRFGCDQAETARTIRGVNTLLLSASTQPTPDIVALAATADNDGIATVAAPSGTGAFAVAIVNVGSPGVIIASADTGAVGLPVSLSLCRTDAETGQCATPPSTAAALDLGANATATLSVFVAANGPLPFDPANNRVFVSFKDGGGVVRGATSVALRSQ